MITSSGAICDVCGKYILPLNPEEVVNTFSVESIPNTEFNCDNKCKQIIIDIEGDWSKLPVGPLKEAYEQALLILKQSN